MYEALKFPIVAFVISIIGLIYVFFVFKFIKAQDSGSENIKYISELIKQGAKTFLKREMRAIFYFVVSVFFILFLFISKYVAIAFILGAFISLVSGFIGMKTATTANAKTAFAGTKGIYEAFKIAFSGGAVMGISVVSLGLAGISFVFMLYFLFFARENISVTASVFAVIKSITGFSMGASSVALFARVGGGIYTKAADMGADLVGKIEQNIPEDDPKNPAVIADNVGDNVGDVYGMGADLCESYVGAIISGFVIASTYTKTLDLKTVMLFFALSGWGIISSIFGVVFIHLRKNDLIQKLMKQGVLITFISIFVGSFILTVWWYGSIGFFICVLTGLLCGALIGLNSEYYTSGKVVESIANSYKTGPATGILHGIAYSMKSVVSPLIIISIAIIISYKFGGVLGIALAAIGMLSTTGITVAVDAYGPIADNAAGISEMAGLGKEARERAEKLDTIGNTTAAVGKGFALGSAALTALALFVAYSRSVNLFSINVLNPQVIAGAFIGGIVPFLFCYFTMESVRCVANQVVNEVRRQFKNFAGLREGTAKPDYDACINIATKGALKGMIVPSILVVCLPVSVGIVMGKEALGGFLVGSLISGIPLALFLANSGGAWDNAKKYIEQGNLGGKGTDIHKASVIGDTLGDSFKDTSGPSLNILLKLMGVVSLVFASFIDKINGVIYGFFS
ncbi:sodium-translocating pyrophosphatase [bacterium]